ncbi:hypothetical protein GCK72_004072 [Caenorhabditis remanei]|uniref:Uncharacterized protein n=1 Tax=Caenorhabditis remanei TaxID=31234 RepID=A0A6A5HAB1_CAERE|nr:hypothetical protein GCK72_004072 [Caenorhabditis remanei]KAF1764125.1 hypothetical protein GCK72_004072 [Caenorhabditis remanei]
MLPLIPLLLLLHLHISPISTLHPIHPCSPSPSITFRGSNDVTRAGGPALIVFAPLQCANCYNYLRRLNDLAASRSYRISVVAPDFESNHIIQRTKTAFPNLQIDRAGEGWPRLGAKNFDAMVLDACSRVTDTFQWPQSDVTTSSAIQTALDSTSIKCGGGVQKCQVVTSSGSHSKKRVNAWIKEQQEAAEQLRRRSQNPQNPQNPQNLQYHYQNPQNLQNLHIPSNPHQQAYYPQNHQNQNPSHLQNSQNHQNPQNPQNLNSNSYQNHNSYNNGYQSLYTPPPPPVPPQVVPTEKATTTTTTDPSSDYDYYPESDSLPITTQSTQTQIPRPPSSSPYGNTWPTYSPFFQHPQNQWNAQYPYQQQNPYQKSGPPPPNMMDANLPCSAFTDDICHQQREQMGALVSKCCNKGIYLTDVCIPGKCSNSTTQLCCFQKFLQAKYSCCNDPTQDEGAPKMTNKFNKCCHNLFVTDDPCCPESAARRYWSTAYEVCMPTVTVDFSPVRFEVHFTEGVRVLDLSVDRQWEFNCTYGVKQPQFAYLPSDHIVVADFIRGL